MPESRRLCFRSRIASAPPIESSVKTRPLRPQHARARGQTARGQGNVRGDDHVASCDVLRDPVVRRVGGAVDDHHLRARPGRDVQPRVGDQGHRDAVARGDGVDLLLHRTRIRVDDHPDQSALPFGHVSTATRTVREEGVSPMFEPRLPASVDQIRFDDPEFWNAPARGARGRVRAAAARAADVVSRGVRRRRRRFRCRRGRATGR